MHLMQKVRLGRGRSLVLELRFDADHLRALLVKYWRRKRDRPAEFAALEGPKHAVVFAGGAIGCLTTFENC